MTPAPVVVVASTTDWAAVAAAISTGVVGVFAIGAGYQQRWRHQREIRRTALRDGAVEMLATATLTSASARTYQAALQNDSEAAMAAEVINLDAYYP
jgi:hypothetical protein